MNELTDEIFKEEEKGLAKYYKKFIPKRLRIYVYFIFLVVSFVGGYDSRPFIEQKINSQKAGVLQNGLINFFIGGKVKSAETSVYQENKSSCPFKYCSDFKDDKWEYKERFTVIQDDPLVLKSPNTQALPGATMFFGQEVGNFTSQMFITPLASPSANLSVVYGHFLRCIIGDGDYSKISCQINAAYPKTIEDWRYFDSNGNIHGRYLRYQIAHFSKGNELQLRFSILKINDRTQIEIKLNDQVPLDWFLPEEFEKRIKMEKVGVGLFTAGEEDVEAVFKQFQLDPHI